VSFVSNSIESSCVVKSSTVGRLDDVAAVESSLVHTAAASVSWAAIEAPITIQPHALATEQKRVATPVGILGRTHTARHSERLVFEDFLSLGLGLGALATGTVQTLRFLVLARQKAEPCHKRESMVG
jgi:hypothetical protein